ncbi:MAG: TonB family protein [Crocinitomicaceae bacterium]|jgi:TonB family protein
MKTFFALFFFLPFMVFAGKSYTLTIQVTDLYSNEPVVGAQIYMNDKTDESMLTNSEGVYIFSECKVKKGTVKVVHSNYLNGEAWIFNKELKDENKGVRMNPTKTFLNTKLEKFREEVSIEMETLRKELDTSIIADCDEEGESHFRDANFPGGDEYLQKFIAYNVNYPQAAIEMEEQGEVKIFFVVEKDGSITNIQVEKSISKALDIESIRVIGEMPKWIPAYCKGKPIKIKATVPVVFRLQYN